MKLYTIGEIFRQGLLKNHKGEPYAHKASVSKALSKCEYEISHTPFGESKCFTEEKINELNKKWDSIKTT